jgi:hypothetical protein
MALSKVLTVTIAVLLATGGLAACGGDDGDDSSDRDVPQGSVAIVGDAEITRADLQERVAALRRVQKASGGGEQQASTSAKVLKEQALSTLLLAAALEQEAETRGVEVTDAEVRKTWDGVAAKQFKNKKQLQRFLGGQSEQDILDQLRLQALNERVLADVSEEAGGGKEGAKAATQFQKKFQQRWREKTTCGESQQSSAMCGSGD